MHYILPLYLFICAFMLLYTYIHVYIGVFWLAFGLVLCHCSPWWGEPPTTPRELLKTAKCMCSIGKILQHLTSALHLRPQDNREGKWECKVVTKKLNNDANMLEKKFFFSGHNHTCFNLNNWKAQENQWSKAFVYNSLCCRQCIHSCKVQVTSPHYTRHDV